jgi:hypothetical protein
VSPLQAGGFWRDGSLGYGTRIGRIMIIGPCFQIWTYVLLKATPTWSTDNERLWHWFWDWVLSGSCPFLKQVPCLPEAGVQSALCSAQPKEFPAAQPRDLLKESISGLGT